MTPGAPEFHFPAEGTLEELSLAERRPIVLSEGKRPEKAAGAARCSCSRSSPPGAQRGARRADGHRGEIPEEELVGGHRRRRPALGRGGVSLREESAALRMTKIAAINEAGINIISTLDLSRLLKLVATSACLILEAETCVIRLLDPETGKYGIREYYGMKTEGEQKDLFLMDKKAATIVLKGEASVLVRDASQEPGWRDFAGVARTLACVPPPRGRGDPRDRHDLRQVPPQDVLSLLVHHRGPRHIREIPQVRREGGRERDRLRAERPAEEPRRDDLAAHPEIFPGAPAARDQPGEAVPAAPRPDDLRGPGARAGGVPFPRRSRGLGDEAGGEGDPRLPSRVRHRGADQRGEVRDDPARGGGRQDERDPADQEGDRRRGRGDPSPRQGCARRGAVRPRGVPGRRRRPREADLQVEHPEELRGDAAARRNDHRGLREREERGEEGSRPLRHARPFARRGPGCPRGAGRRQVSLLAVESIAKMKAKGLSVGPGDFAENITVEGIDLVSLRPGSASVRERRCSRSRRSGKSATTGAPSTTRRATASCRRRGFARVLHGGTLRAGDPMEKVEA